MSKTMKAVVFDGQNNVELKNVPVPQLQNDTDVIVKVELSTICGTDVHIKNGALPVDAGRILGHEFVGVVEEVGSRVTTLKAGDRVAANCITSCGECYYCQHGYVNHCENGGWIFGYQIDGCQAEYVRVPYADRGLFKIPESMSYKDALFVGDILSTGYFGAERGDIEPGDTVVVLGAGPVGMCAMASAQLFGPARVIAVDTVDSRLNTAVNESVADIAFNPLKDDVEKEILALTSGRGADVVIEAAGVKPTFDLSWKLARPNGTVSIIALFSESQILPLETMGGKNLTIRTGWVDATHMDELLALVETKKIDLNFLATHEAPLDQVLDGYKVFGNKEDNCLKWLVTPSTSV